MKRSLGAALSIALAAGGGVASAQPLPPPDRRAVFSLLSENDSFAQHSDRWYTNGFRFGWSSAEGSLPSPLAWVDGGLAGLFGPAQTRWGLALGQNLYTP